MNSIIQKYQKFIQRLLIIKKSENEQDAKYDEGWKNYIDNLFVNYPFCLLSHIKFFDILTSNEKESNYLLHRIANSVVIIDEIQSYTPTEWDKMNYLIQKYSEMMNITFIIMSATLPKISKLLFDTSGYSKDTFVYLIENKMEYFSNCNFKDRVKFQFDYLDQDLTLEQLGRVTLKHSDLYFSKHQGVKAIIEFVTKISAHRFYDTIIKECLFCGYEIYLITGTILEPRRKEIIKYLKSDESTNKKILVVCTQVIEAGLDIDMDIGFKDKAIIDSEEQFAGRINRNAFKQDSELFIFNLRDSKKTYKADLRYKLKFDYEIYKQILLNKEYDFLYNKVFEMINKDLANPYLDNNLSDFISQIQALRFKDVREKFELIKDNTISIYVPCLINKNHFSFDEIEFLQKYDKNICNQTMVDGEIIWNIYDTVSSNKEKNFNKKVDLKIISSLLTKFTFNVWKNPTTINLLKHYSESELKYGFLKLLKSEYKKIYSYENGLIDKEEIETDCNFI